MKFMPAGDSEDAKRLLSCNLQLGREKAISYLPIRTIERWIGMSADKYVAKVESVGFEAVALSMQECCISSGAVYAYSRTHLDILLRDNQAILLAHQWPLTSTEFVRRIAAEWLDE